MSKKRYPKSEAIHNAEILSKEAYVSWDGDNQSKAFAAYAEALQEGRVDRAVANTNRDFRNLTSGVSGRPGLRGHDFDWFRPGQAAPSDPKDIIAFARYAYRRIGIIHNCIDLMGDFSSQGVRLVHRNKTVENFYNNWFNEVGGKRITERIGHLLCREANVPIRAYTARINNKKRKDMQQAIASVDLDIRIDDVEYVKKEIPWRYSFIDPLLVEPIGGPLTTLSTRKILSLKIPLSLQNLIKSLQQNNKPEAKEALSKISPDIIEAANRGTDVILPTDKTYLLHYKKDDWQTWADPMVYSAFEPLNLYQRLQLTDKAATDGAMNKIRVWKIGSLEHKLAPTPTASSTLADLLGANVGGGTIDIVWGPDIELLETSSDIQSYLGEDKYKPTLTAIYASLGIPPTLTGSGSGGTTNNFIALKTLVERLNYVRSIIVDFWEEQVKIVQKAMGFRYPASIEFDIMYLEDPAAMTTLLLNMADRNIISDEFVQRNVKAIPEIENNRMNRESKQRDRYGVEKVSPYHEVDKEHDLKKIVLQNGTSTPSEVGLDLKERKAGEKTIVEMRGVPNSPNSPGSPGRPKNSKDIMPRKEKTFKPKLKASTVELWAKKAQGEISKVINPLLLHAFNKKNLRSLTTSEFNQLERIKFEILCNLEVGQDIDELSIATAANKPSDQVIHEVFDSWVKESEMQFGKLTIEQIRDIRISYYAHYKSEN